MKLEALPYRTLRATYSASVLPSLEVSGTLLPSMGADSGRLLTLRGLNLHGLSTFQLTDLVLPSSTWAASVVGSEGRPHNGLFPLGDQVSPDSSTVLHIQLHPGNAAATLDDQASAAERHLRTAEAAPRRPAAAADGVQQQAATMPSNLMLRWRSEGLPDAPAVEGFSMIPLRR